MKNRLKKERKLRIEKKASKTALFAAIHRFMATKGDRPNFKGPDNLAVLFLNPITRFILSLTSMRRKIYTRLDAEVKGTHEYMFARTEYFDMLFKDALEENVSQIVLLGAGYDTRALRFKESIKDTRIFEMDAPTTQKEKLRLLRKAKISIPRQLFFVPINFNKESLNDVLPKAGYDRSKKSIFLWEGVTYYLTGEAVKETLASIRNNSGPESSVAFDYFYKSAIERKTDFYGSKEICEAVSRNQEPFQFGIEDGQIKSFLSEQGFEVISHYRPEEFEQEFLYNKKGEFFGRMYGFVCNVHARVK